nr:ribonuclease H-like domain-containing protein [Tanacetum cinerariifolium]
MVHAVVLTQSKPVSITAVRPVRAAVPKSKVTQPRHATPIVTNTNSPIRRHLTRSPSLKTNNSSPKVTAVKASLVSAAQGNPQHALKDKGVIDSGCSRHMIGNMSYLSDFEELNGGYVAFGGNPKGGKIFGKGKIRTDSLGKFDGKVDEGFLVGTLDAAFVEKEPEFDAKKPESEVIISLSSSAHSRKQDDKTKKEAKGKSPVEPFIGYRDLNAEFKDYSDNSINEVNAAGILVPTVGQISSNSTNTFSVVGPSNAAASPTHGKSSFIDASQLPDDPDMP